MSRFAPAPTGFLHLGHVVNAIHVWGLMGAMRGRVLVRIEDHDRQRSRPVFEAAILEDLGWLGFHPDGPPVRQGERGDLYAAALDRLRAQGLVYACDCSRKRATAAGTPAQELRYPGACAERGLTFRPGMGLRVRLAPSDEAFVDLRRGLQTQRPSEQCGDLLVLDRDGNWTYQFAATVDDMLQGVTHVIRGADLLLSTGRQIQLARLLGRTDPPRYYHHPLIMKSPTQKLSKSDGDTSVRELRARGWSAARVIGHAAVRSGLISVERELDARDAATLFGERLPPES